MAVTIQPQFSHKGVPHAFFGLLAKLFYHALYVVLVMVYPVGEDFADFGPIFLDYRGGNRKIKVLEFVISIKDDDIPEPPEQFRIYGENTNNLLFPFRFMTVTITDDDESKKY